MARKLKAPGMNKCIQCYSCMISCARYNYHSHSVSRCCLKIRTAGGLAGRYVAEICRSCNKPTCVDVCATEALVAKPGGGALFYKDKCIGCKKCIDVCKIQYLEFDDELKLPLMCKHCGICVRFCPHNCLEMEADKGGIKNAV